VAWCDYFDIGVAGRLLIRCRWNRPGSSAFDTAKPIIVPVRTWHPPDSEERANGGVDRLSEAEKDPQYRLRSALAASIFLDTLNVFLFFLSIFNRRD